MNTATATPYFPEQGATLEEAREALFALDPDCDRADWVKIGMAAKAAGLDFDDFDRWSAGGRTYKPKDVQAVWKSFSPSGGVTERTLFKLARDAGWRPERSAPISPEEAARRQAQAERRRLEREASRQKEEAEAERRRQETATLAARLWDAATPVTPGDPHPYLERKGVLTDRLREIPAEEAARILGWRPEAGERGALAGRLLVIPLERDGAIATCELIDGDGRKTSLPGQGTKSGTFWPVCGLPDGNGDGATILVGEGAATALSAHAATGYPAIAVSGTANLRRAAEAMRTRYPAARVIVLADLDKESGTPCAAAIKAAKEAGSMLAAPCFGEERPEGATDFNDMHQAQGLAAVRQAIEAAKPVRPAPSEQAQAVLIRASELKPEPVHWLWHGWLAAGKLHILAGAPGCGKTTIAMALAATISCGGRWPDGSRATPGNVVVWSGEDDPADTLVPRLILSGGDPDRVLFVRDVQDGGERRPFDPGKDIELLRQSIAEIGDVRLLIIDPVVSAVIGDSHKNGEVRRSLQPLVDLAASCRCAVLGISHFSKGSGGRDPVERVVGSLAFGALARIVLAAAKVKADDGSERRILCRSKSNIGQDDGGYEYALMAGEPIPGLTATAVTWGRTIEGSARELLADPDEDGDTGDGSSMADAKQFLRDLLADGPMRAGDVFKEAEQAGYARRTIQRAANVLKVDRRKDGMKGGWTWRLPPEDAKTPPEGAEDANKKSLAPTASSAPSLASSAVVEVEL